MSFYIRKSENVDVMFLAEGTYPYIKGGVSSWIAQIINGMPDINFGVCFIGSQASDYDDIQYTLPDNVVHVEVHYLFDDDKPEIKKRKGNKKAFKDIEKLYDTFKMRNFEMPKNMQDISFYLDKITFDDFLYSKTSWDFINKIYLKNAPDVSFIDYFWTLRNIHRPIWILAKIVKNLPNVKLLHAPSTGYAGFLGTLASYNTNKPLILTEHGIYTRERKIDMLSADWVEFKKPALLQQPEEFNYIKKMWVEFFRKIGEFTYERSENIFSLYAGARDIQVMFGAKEEKTKIIPNGVDVRGLNKTLEQRDEDAKPIITLIGRVVSIKDIKTFIRAIRITANTLTDIEAWIVGPTDEDKEYFQECQQMVKSLQLEQHIKFLGFQNIKDILPKTKLLTLTSISEGMPLVILEGFASGVPCVATNVGSCKDLIKGGLNEDDKALGDAGAITSISSPNETAQCYIKFLTDKNLYKKAQDVALERVKKYYQQDIFLATYKNVYLEKINRSEK